MQNLEGLSERQRATLAEGIASLRQVDADQRAADAFAGPNPMQHHAPTGEIQGPGDLFARLSGRGHLLHIAGDHLRLARRCRFLGSPAGAARHLSRCGAARRNAMGRN